MIEDDVAGHARRAPDGLAAVAVDSAGRDSALTWAQLWERSGRAATTLSSYGLRPGDAVAYQLPNRLEFLTLTLGALRIGAVCEPLMPIFRERELRFMLAESAAPVLVVPDQFRGHDHGVMARELIGELPGIRELLVLREGEPPTFEACAPDADAVARRRPAPDAIAQLLFTSGSTGEPKGVLHRHEVLDRAADAHIAHFGLRSDDVIYIPSPLAHQTGWLYGMWIAWRLGATQVIQESWDAQVGFDAIVRHGVTFTQAATPFLADLVRVAGERAQDGRAANPLRMFVATGAAIPRDLARRSRTVLDAEVGGGFGTTESCMGAGFVPGVDDERAWTSDGVALANVSLRVVDDEGRVLPAGVEGHFEIGTDTLFAGYLNRPAETAVALAADGYYRPGDLATIDADGYLRITGRVKDVINRGGEKVPVAEIEQLLYEHPAVEQAAIVAMPDERLGERACAFVVLAAGAELDFASMQRYLDGRRVAKPYWPERLEVVAALPRTPSGKIQKFVLREHARQFTEERRKAIAR
ncbi:MAG TPA: AMP-binding protein [Solirubrobacteraceae bacterium]|nr:AMP-binding protein [Solirubrobacteraceae bacterium]